VLASHSRGGGLTWLVLAAGVLIWGLAQWRPQVALSLRVGLILTVAVGVVVIALWGGNYVKRFKEYPWRQIEASDRYQMTMGALRGWRSAPWLGIGPGMHQNLWPHFAASGDGNRSLGKRPTYLNATFHSYEAHNDWAQFLEEYGVVGMVLFVGMLGGLGQGLYRGWRREVRERNHSGFASTGRTHHALTLAALLAGGAFCFHSAGDFNLQIPATVWLLAALIAAPLGLIGQEQRGVRRHREQSWSGTERCADV
ncbi:MAG: O-antigen ligase family protein, partial [bacterium]